MKGFTVFGIIVSILNTCCWAEGSDLSYSRDMELSCFTIPAKAKSLCAGVTNRFDDVGNDLVLYQLDEFNQFGLIDVVKSGGAHHWLWGLSAGGKRRYSLALVVLAMQRQEIVIQHLLSLSLHLTMMIAMS